ncbi:MAG TPA: signal peptidase I [Armatimonadota bacterium]|nr:signal peptidase I [Armatimonadota bacterium]
MRSIGGIRGFEAGRQVRSDPTRRIGSRLLWLSIGAAAIGLAWWCPFRIGVVVGASMLPALKPGQPLLLDRRHDKTHCPAIGDIIVFKQDGYPCIKRVAAKPGDGLWLFEYQDAAGRPTYSMVVYPSELARVRQLAGRYPKYCKLERISIPEGRLYVVGDAWNVSVDSRSFGLVRMDQLVARVIAPNPKAPARNLWSGARPSLRQERSAGRRRTLGSGR